MFCQSVEVNVELTTYLGIPFMTGAKGFCSGSAFGQYWRDVNGPLAARDRHVRRYVQSHVVTRAYGGNRIPAFDEVGLLALRLVPVAGFFYQSQANSDERQPRRTASKSANNGS